MTNEDHWCRIESVQDVRSSHFWRSFIDASTINMPECWQCPVFGTCGGGCHYNRPTIDHPNPNFCQYMRSLVFHITQNQ
ncbi:MAG: hypothetical protein HY564_02280 [Candidatus Jacksonbacteria bacterium]|nr:hypothetical protein [Candidatus Jacksonbacteria bacterium]